MWGSEKVGIGEEVDGENMAIVMVSERCGNRGSGSDQEIRNEYDQANILDDHQTLCSTGTPSQYGCINLSSAVQLWCRSSLHGRVTQLVPHPPQGGSKLVPRIGSQTAPQKASGRRAVTPTTLGVVI